MTENYCAFVRNVFRAFSKFRRMRNLIGRWRVSRCQVLGVALLCIQCAVLTLLLYAFLPSSSTSHSALLEDAYDASFVLSSFGAPLIVVGKEILKKGGATRVGWKDKAPFAVQADHLPQILLVATKLKKVGYETVVFYNQKITKFPPEEKTIPIGIAVKKGYPFYISFLYSRIDNFWWHGGIMKDSEVQQKLLHIDLSENDLLTVHMEGIFKKTELVKGTLGGRPMVIPRHVRHWVNSSDSDHEFIECDYEKASTFLKEHRRKFDDTNRFQHKAWKLLSRTQVIMDHLGIPFWLSSGTCLGYFRECGIIPYTTDVDIGVFAKYYSENIVKEFLFRGFYLKHIFGKPNDSYELSFVSNGVKVDLFFFYEEGNTMWNGGTQRSSGKKFKYVFPRFDLCWTEFMDLLVRVPCNTTAYIEANYGADWAVPKSGWVWHESPPNILDNGYWPKDERKDVIQVFHAPEYPFK